MSPAWKAVYVNTSLHFRLNITAPHMKHSRHCITTPTLIIVELDLGETTILGPHVSSRQGEKLVQKGFFHKKCFPEMMFQTIAMSKLIDKYLRV